MIDVQRLESVILFSGFNATMLKKLADRAKLLEVKENQYLFREGDTADSLFVVVEGKVSLEVSQTKSQTTKIKDIFPGRTFGISSLVDTENKRCISDARALVNTLLIKWDADELENLFHEDFQLGFYFMKHFGRVLKERLQIKDAQLAAAL